MADLGYFSHTSPVAEHATLGQRAAQAGSFTLTLGENLARVGPTDAAASTVTGWLESPGHRANLLNADFSHVGFGSAPYPDGQLAVAQVFAYQPAAIAEAMLVSVLDDAPTLDVTLELSRPAEVIVFFGERSSRPVDLPTGERLLHVPLSQTPTLPLAVQLGVRSEGQGFILQDSGWLYPDGWTGEPAIAGRQGELREVALRSSLKRRYEVRLTFDDAPDRELAAWQGEYLLGLVVSGASASVELSDPTSELPLYLGVPQADGRYRALYGFRAEPDALELVPVGALE